MSSVTKQTVTTESQTIKVNFRFYMYDKKM